MEKKIEARGLRDSQEQYRCRIMVLKKIFNELDFPAALEVVDQRVIASKVFGAPQHSC